ncbi:MAG: hypothetical protein ACJA11_002820 [Glaciecola sp.]|jgi:hypothetical protein
MCLLTRDQWVCRTNKRNRLLCYGVIGSAVTVKKTDPMDSDLG